MEILTSVHLFADVNYKSKIVYFIEVPTPNNNEINLTKDKIIHVIVLGNRQDPTKCFVYFKGS